MFWPQWTRKFWKGRSAARRRAPRPSMQDAYRPKFFRLENRRVLDVSAAFLTATGQLEVVLSQSVETAVLSVESGQITIRDRQQQVVPIAIDGGNPGTVTASQVAALEVRGDGAPEQIFTVASPLELPRGLEVDAEVDRFRLAAPLSHLTQAGARVDSPQIELAADLLADGQDIVFSGDVVLATDVRVSGQDVRFESVVDSLSPNNLRSLTVLGSSTTEFRGSLGSTAPLSRLTTDAPGTTLLAGQVSIGSGGVQFLDRVVLTDDVRISGLGASTLQFAQGVESSDQGFHDLRLATATGRVVLQRGVGDSTSGDHRLGDLVIESAPGGVILGQGAGDYRIEVAGRFTAGAEQQTIGGLGIRLGEGHHNFVLESGEQARFNGPTILLADTAVTTATGGIWFTSAAPLDSDPNSAAALLLNAGGGDVRLQADVGATSPLRGLSIVRADAGVLFGGVDASAGATTSTFRQLRSVAPIRVGGVGGPIAAGIVLHGTDTTPLQITTTNDDIQFFGPVALRSSVSISTGPLAGDIVFRSGEVQGESGRRHDLILSAGQGSVLFGGSVGSVSPLGLLQIVQASGGVSWGLSLPTGTEPATRIAAENGIDIGVASQAITGTGIVFRGGGAPVEVTTGSGDLRFNGAVTLESDLRLQAHGRVTLTNATPVNSASGQLRSLSIATQQGLVAINASLGGLQPLSSFQVTTAPGGLLLGEATTATGGIGGRGPVEVLRAFRGIELGTPGQPLSGAGIVLTGSAIAPQRWETENGPIRLRGAVTLVTDVSLHTGPLGANIGFSGDSPVNSGSDRLANLTIDAGTGRLEFNHDLGAARPLGEFTVIRADGGVFLGGAASPSADHELGPVQVIRADRPIHLGTVAAGIVGGITFQGGSLGTTITTSGDSIRVHGPVSLHSSLAIETGAGDAEVLFTRLATVDRAGGSGANSGSSVAPALHINAGQGSVRLQANLGALRPLGSVTVSRADAGVRLGASTVGPTGDDGPVTQVITTQGVTFGDRSQRGATLGPIHLAGGGQTLTFNGGTGGLWFAGPLTMHSAVTWVADSGVITLTAAASVDSGAASSQNLRVEGGTAVLDWNGDLGSQVQLRELQLVSHAGGAVRGNLRAGRIVQQASTGELLLAGAIATNDPVQSGFAWTGSALTISGTLTTTGNGEVRLQHTGTLRWEPSAQLRLAGAFHDLGPGTTLLAGSLTTDEQEIQFLSPVIIRDTNGSPTRLDTTASGTRPGAEIRFAGTIDGVTAGRGDLVMRAGTAGSIVMEQAVGAATQLGNWTIHSAHDTRWQASLLAAALTQTSGSGTTSFLGSLDLLPTGGLGLDLTTERINFHGNVTVGGTGTGVALTPGTELLLADGTVHTIRGSWEQRGAAPVQWGADLLTSGGAIRVAGAVTLTSHVQLGTGPGTEGITWQGAVNSQTGTENLLLLADAGNILFAAGVGTTQQLGSVTIAGAGDVTFLHNLLAKQFQQLAGTGTTTLGGTLSRFAEGFSVVTGAFALRGAATATGDIRVQVVNEIVVEGPLLSTSGNLTLHSSGGGATLAGGSRLQSQTGQLTVNVQGDLQLSELRAPLSITLISRGGAITDGGDLVAVDLESSQILLEAARGIGLPDGPPLAQNSGALELVAGTLVVRNTTAGGIFLHHVGSQMLQVVNATAGLPGLEQRGAGAIELTSNAPLLVRSAILHRGGGDTRLATQGTGDLTLRAPVQNTGGNGSIVLLAAGNLVVNDSLPEPPLRVEDVADPTQFYEILVSGTGAVRGRAGGQVLLDEGNDHYVIVRTASGQVTHVTPLLQVRIIDQGGSDIDEQGRGIVEVELGEGLHFESNFHLMFDWGDGETENFPLPGTIHPGREQASRETRFVSVPAGNVTVVGPGIYRITHKYFAHPNEDDPAQPIPIRVELRQDARASGELSIDAGLPAHGSAVFNGIRFFDAAANEIFSAENRFFTVPGTGGFSFVKVVESVIVPVEARAVVAAPPPESTVITVASSGLRNEFRTARFESQVQAEYQLFLRVVDDVSGREGEERIPLDLSWLNDPLALFRQRRFPNGHYRVYLEEVRTRRVRVILDVHVFDGKVVPPNFRDGTGDRQPEANDAR